MPQAAVSASPFPVSEKAHADLPVLLLPPHPPHLPSLKTLDLNLLSGVEKGKSMFFHCLSQGCQATFSSQLFICIVHLLSPLKPFLPQQTSFF